MFHAKHLKPPDLDSVFGNLDFPKLTVKPEYSLVLGSGHRLDGGTDLRTLALEAIREIFHAPLDWFEIEKTLAVCTQSTKSQVTFVGPTSFMSQIIRSLKPFESWSHAGFDHCKTDEHTTELYEENQIAIVGMSGRWPGCDDLDAFWKVLSEGRDLCQEVNMPLLKVGVIGAWT